MALVSYIVFRFLLFQVSMPSIQYVKNLLFRFPHTFICSREWTAMRTHKHIVLANKVCMHDKLCVACKVQNSSNAAEYLYNIHFIININYSIQLHCHTLLFE